MANYKLIAIDSNNKTHIIYNNSKIRLEVIAKRTIKTENYTIINLK